MTHLVADALDLAQHFVGPDRIAYAVSTAVGDGFELQAGLGWELGIVGYAGLSGGPTALSAYTLQLGRTVVVEDLRLAPVLGEDALLVSTGTISALTAPVRGQSGSSGLLGAFSSSRRLFGPDDAEFLQGIADVISAALYRQEWQRHSTRPSLPWQAKENPAPVSRTPAGKWDSPEPEDDPC
ncbi:MAG: GAF domain-containing protein [Gemmatimonadota bacterium]